MFFSLYRRSGFLDETCLLGLCVLAKLLPAFFFILIYLMYEVELLSANKLRSCYRI